MVTKTYRIALYTMTCISLTVCAVDSLVVSDTIMACEFENFAKLDKKNQELMILKCDLEKQVELYLAWSSYTLPGNTDYADEIAQSGESLIPSLLSRLEKHEDLEDDIKKPELLIVLDIMQRAGHYPVARDKNLMTRIEKAVGKIKDEYIKDWALEIISYIKEQKYQKEKR